MDKIPINIDGKEVKVKPGKTLLEASKLAGVKIPTLCYHELLKPFGACRLCMVEIEDSSGGRKLVASCVHPVIEPVKVLTRSLQVDLIRKVVLELMMTNAPDSPKIQELAKEYGAVRGRFETKSTFCVHCGLCVRYCEEVKGKNAIGFVERGMRKEISFVPEIALKECLNCKECFPLCPTSYLQTSFVLTQSLNLRF